MSPLLDPVFVLDLLGALRLRSRRLRPIETATRAELCERQRRRLADVLAHAARHSPFYGRRWRGRTPGPDDLPALEPVDKTTLLVDHFADAVTIPELRTAGDRRRLRRRGARQRGRYIFVATSGTTGEPAVVPFSRSDWRAGMAAILRSADAVAQARWSTDAAGLRTVWNTVRERPRVAGISTLNPIHVSSQMSASFQCGLVPSLRLSASQSLAEQVERLERFRPTAIGAYPSALEQLVGAAEDGALVIRPELVFTGGETVTPRLRRRVHKAWNAEIFDFYGLTETLIVAGECGAHAGMHLYEDLVVLEVVDEDGRPVPPGERGAGVYLTSLINHTLPIIRYAVTDLMAVTDEPCPCGAPFRRIVAVEGRLEEMIDLRRRGGGMTRIHPFVIEAPLEEMGEVRQFRLTSAGDGSVRIVVVPSGVAPNDRPDDAPADGTETAAGRAQTIRARVHDRVAATLAPQGVTPECITVETVNAIAPRRGATDKRVRAPTER